MSTLLYQSLTTRRQETVPTDPDGTRASGRDPRAAHVIDSLAALVPLEVLAAHGVILGEVSTTTQIDADTTVTTLTDVGTAQACWWFLLVAALALYAVPHLHARGRWHPSDFVRMLIPPAAFAAWTLTQRGTLFDAVRAWDSETRTVVGVLIAMTLTLATKMLATRADEATPEFRTARRSTVEVAEIA
jgi:hypothetical protein